VSPFSFAEERLSASDYRRLAPIFASMGVSKVRFTGGEPLLRRDLVEVIAAFREGLPKGVLALTTNGQRLASSLEVLARAGLSRATVHVDSLRPDRYRDIMGDFDVHAVLDALLAARAHLDEVKVNMVVQRGRNDDEIGDFLEWSRITGVEVRFIELMNTGSAVDYTRQVFFSGQEIVEAARGRGGATPVARKSPSDPASRWRTDDGLEFGVIASDTEPFCGDCNRMRLSAKGTLYGCLYQASGVDLRRVLRDPPTEEDIARTVRRAFDAKRSFHPDVGPRIRAFSMAETGG
jgi:cyclic pyranopterin phosphate synthase